MYKKVQGKLHAVPAQCGLCNEVTFVAVDVCVCVCAVNERMDHCVV
jgi:hypothetical protein